MLILASKSPRRKELLSVITKDFIIKSANVDETLPDGISPDEAVKYLSAIKAQPLKNGTDTIIGADTVVAVGGKILGKPADENEAFEMLKLLSGKTHSVFTGVTIITPDSQTTFCVETKVTFFELSDREINEYIALGESLDKAGAYAIQGRGSLFVEKIDGDYFNVVGLPISLLSRKLSSMIQ